MDAVHLGNEDSCNRLIQGSSVHVDGGTDWEDETSDSLVNTQVLLQTTEGDGQSTSTGRKKQIKVVYAVRQVQKYPKTTTDGFILMLTWRQSPGQ